MTLSKKIFKLLRLIHNEGDKEDIEKVEKDIAIEIEKAVKEKRFEEIPMKNVLEILAKTNELSFKECVDIAEAINKKRGPESVIILSALNTQSFEFSQCTRIFASFTNSKFLDMYKDLFEEESKLLEKEAYDDRPTLKRYHTEVDSYNQTIKELNQEISKMKVLKEPLPKLETKQFEKRKFEPLNSDFKNKHNIWYAAQEGKLKDIQYLYEKDYADPNEKDVYGYAPLHYAAKYNHLDIVQYLFEVCNADVEIQSSSGCTPLHLAIEAKNMDIVQYLVKNCKANVKAKTFKGEDPLTFAIKYKQFEITRFLVEYAKVKIDLEYLLKMECPETWDYVCRPRDFSVVQWGNCEEEIEHFRNIVMGVIKVLTSNFPDSFNKMSAFEMAFKLLVNPTSSSRVCYYDD